MKVFNIANLTKITKHLGTGGNACVFECVYSGKTVAVKFAEGGMDEIGDEVLYSNIVQNSSPNFLKFYAAGSASGESIKKLVGNHLPDDDEKCIEILESSVIGVIVMQNVVSGVTLHEWLSTNTATKQQIEKIMLQLILSVYIMHTRFGLQHNDLKEANVLCASYDVQRTLSYKIEDDLFQINLKPNDPHIFIFDFDAAKLSVEKEKKTLRGTPGYYPVESWVDVKRFIKRGPEGDIFALGIMMLTMLSSGRNYKLTWGDKNYTLKEFGDSIVWADILNKPLDDEVSRIKKKDYDSFIKESTFKGNVMYSRYMFMRFYWLQKELGAEQPGAKTIIGKRPKIISLFKKKKNDTFNPFEGLRKTIIDVVHVPGLQLLKLLLAWSPDDRLRFGSRSSKWGLFNAIFHPFFANFHPKETKVSDEMFYNPPLAIAFDDKITTDYKKDVEKHIDNHVAFTIIVNQQQIVVEKEELKKATMVEQQKEQKVIEAEKVLKEKEEELDEGKITVQEVTTTEEALEKKEAELEEAVENVEKEKNELSEAEIRTMIGEWKQNLKNGFGVGKFNKNKRKPLFNRWVKNIKILVGEIPIDEKLKRVLNDLEIYVKRVDGEWQWPGFDEFKTTELAVQAYSALQIIAGNVVLNTIGLGQVDDVLQELENADAYTDIITIIDNYAKKEVQSSTHPENGKTGKEKEIIRQLIVDDDELDKLIKVTDVFAYFVDENYDYNNKQDTGSVQSALLELSYFTMHGEVKPIDLSKKNVKKHPKLFTSELLTAKQWLVLQPVLKALRLYMPLSSTDENVPDGRSFMIGIKSMGSDNLTLEAFKQFWASQKYHNSRLSKWPENSTGNMRNEYRVLLMQSIVDYIELLKAVVRNEPEYKKKQKTLLKKIKDGDEITAIQSRCSYLLNAHDESHLAYKYITTEIRDCVYNNKTQYNMKGWHALSELLTFAEQDQYPDSRMTIIQSKIKKAWSLERKPDNYITFLTNK